MALKSILKAPTCWLPEPLVTNVAVSVELPEVMVKKGVMARKLLGTRPLNTLPETTFVGSAVPVIDHVAPVNGVPLRVPVMSPPVAVYVRVEALATIGVARMQAAIAMINRILRRRIFIEIARNLLLG